MQNSVERLFIVLIKLELFLRIVKDVYDTQEEENRQAFVGAGDFEMSDFF